MDRKMMILGCGGHAKSIIDTLLKSADDTCNWNIILVDKNGKPNELVLGFPVYTSMMSVDIYQYSIFIASGDNCKRKMLYNYLKSIGADGCIVNIVSKDASISNFANIGRGNFIAFRAYVGPECEIGNNCIINTQAIIEHETVVGDYVHISSGSVICGKGKIGSNVFIGANSVIKDKVSICDNVTLGAGSTVINNIEIPGTYVGIPAKKIGMN